MLPVAFLALMLAQVSPDVPVSIVPETPDAKFVSNTPIVLKAKTPSKSVTWRVSAGAQFREVDGGLAIHVWAAPGAYTVEAFVCGPNGKVVFAEYKLTVGGTSPLPPRVDDSLRKDLQALYAAEAAPDKAVNGKRLANLYREAALLAAKTEGVDTGAQLLAAVKATADTLIPDPKALEAIRKRVAVELGLKLKLADRLTDEARAYAADVYNRAALALEDALR